MVLVVDRPLVMVDESGQWMRTKVEEVWINVERLLSGLEFGRRHTSDRILIFQRRFFFSNTIIHPSTSARRLLLSPPPRITMQHDMAPPTTSSAAIFMAATSSSALTHEIPPSPPAVAIHSSDACEQDPQPEPSAEAATSPIRSPRKRSTESPVSSPRRKRVRWSTITVHEFGIGLGGSAVSDRGGPSIGLADKPEFTWTTKVGEMAECSEGIHRFTPDQRTRLLKAAGISDGMITRYARETSIILKSRRKTSAEGADESSDEEDEEEVHFLDDDDDETDDSDSDDDLDMYSRKRKAPEPEHSIYMNRPQFLPMRRPRMIPANYV